MPSSERAVIPCVFTDHSPKREAGTLVYFHPGGLPSSLAARLKDKFSQWRILRVEMMLCAPYVEATKKDGRVINDIDTIAKNILEHLNNKLPPDHPVVFIGWSFGGVVSYQVAQLWQHKQKPDLVFIDSIAPVSGQSFSEKNISEKQTLNWFVEYLQCLKSCQLKINLPFFGGVDEEKILRDVLSQAIAQGAFDKNTKYVAFRKVFTTFTQGLMRNSKLTATYTAAPFPGRALLIRAKKGLLWRFKFIRDMGWKPLIDNLTMTSIDVDHYEIISQPSSVQTIETKIFDFIQHYESHAALSECEEVTS